jgi:alginate O-acetyltransferase complex protein AlgI
VTSGLLLNSWAFLVFASLAILCVRLAPTTRLRKAALLAFSIVFIGTYITTLLAMAVLIGILAVMYLLGLPWVRSRIGWSGVTVSVTITALWAFLFLVKDPTLLGAANPFRSTPVAIIGISYMVFRGISYLMESESVPDGSLLDFLNYILFFPTLLAGPIERYKDFGPSYATPNNGPADVLPALHRIANGLIKKFVIADNLAVFSVAANTDLANTPVSLLWLAVLLQLFLIYLDFSGYCDIAIGIASLMGIKVQENFNKPFLAVNIQDFWDRWHISMSSLMRDYVFTPTCKEIFKRFPPAMHWPLIVAAYCFVMMLVALWHGTTTGFLVFGMLHGAVLVAIQIRARGKGRRARSLTGFKRYLWMAITYLFVSFTMVLWMLPGTQWLAYYKAMFRGLLP